MKKSFVILILIVLLASCQKNNLSEINDSTAQLIIKTIGNTTTESFDGFGYTAMGMLKKNHNIKTSFKNSIKCIDGVCAESGYWWPLYVNGEKASLGPQSYIVKNNDRVEFVLSKK